MPEALGAIALVFLVLLLFGVPIAYVMVLSVAFYIVWINPAVPLVLIPQRMIGLPSESFTLLAVPLFLLAGSLLNASGMTTRLVRFAEALVGHVRGGIGHSVVVANMVMAGMSGSAVADAAASGSMLIPAMKTAGYRPANAAALVASASTIGPLIPPSIPMVLYSSFSNVSLGRLLLGGAIPGFIMGLYLMVAVYVLARREGLEPGKFSWAEVWRGSRDAILALFMPVIILGGMFSGVYTPTEGAGAAVLYALVVGGLIYRTLTPRAILACLRETTMTTSTVLLIAAAANALSFILTSEQAGKVVSDLLHPFESSPLLTLLAVAGALLILGIPLDPAPLLVLFVAILAPVAARLGIDPVHFGVVFVLAVMIGEITPPVGGSMFVTCRVAGVSVGQFSGEVWPYFAALLLALLTIIMLPDLVLALPRLVMGR